MAPSTFVLLFALLLASLAATSDASFDLRAELNHPYAGSPLSNHEMLRDAAMASKARRRAWNDAASVAIAADHGAISDADVLVRPFGRSEHTLTVGVGTPPQPRTLLLDTGSDLIWTHCKLLGGKHREPLYDPAGSSSFAAVPCDGRLCETGSFNTKNCSSNKCLYTYDYGSATTRGELASETFTFGEHHKVSVSLDFGCGRLTSGSIDGASGILGISPDKLSLVSQLQIPRFSYCLTPFLDRDTSHMFFGAMADLSKYRTTGPIQTTYLVRDPSGRNYYYYVPLIGISVGTKRLNVTASSFAIGLDGGGGTFVDSGDTTGMLPSVAMEALKEALAEAVKLPVLNGTDLGYELCFQLPKGMTVEAVQAPPLVYHFDGGAAMVLPRENFFVEASPGEMCLVISSGGARGAIIGNYQQQNMHVLFDVQNHKFSFSPTQCDQI
ncbi:hypothetical protein SETIT_6G179000v2 [Setaria italica]|uniref:Peptidase A1 domain-containing protein n=1 Tax=Setaria italica TaxID=4555 RepID=K3YHP6_SETIT|nr:aspartic proteinase nepenthesin-1 [Setaria italica]RCV31458.1 hypothetical protein SETIT_6G179000v2 [Setaria italica]